MAQQFTEIIEKARNGDSSAREKLLGLAYDELRRLASGQMRKENSGHTLQATALVHEAYIRLAGQENVEWQNKSHFIGIAAQIMRRVLLDHARAKHADKRGGSDRVCVTLIEDITPADDTACDIVALNDALTKLEAMSERQARIVEMRCFGGLSVEETAEALGIAAATVKRDWTLARAWLLREITGSDSQ